MKSLKNKLTSILMTGLMVCVIVFTSGCSQALAWLTGISSQATTQTDPTEPELPTTEVSAGDTSLNSLRQAMIETPQLFAVAYFGYHETLDSDLPVDPYAVMQENACWLCADLPFLLEIPEDRIVGETGDLFCIVPLDENATVAVSKGCWDEENQQYIYDDMLYSSKTGDPILLFCNNAGWEPDTQVYISGQSGEVFYYPQTDDNVCAAPLRNEAWEDLFFDFSPYRELLMKSHRDMKDSEWVMPTAEMLAGTTWSWDGFLKDGREVSYRVTFEESVLSVLWNDGIDEQDHEYLYADWELTYDEGFAILSIDFGEFAGVLRYNLLYHEVYERLYVAMDVVQEDMPIGWEPLYRFLTRPVAPDPVEMVGMWELTWTEIEGDRTEAEPVDQIIEITLDDAGLFWIDYTNNGFPQKSYYGKELVVFPFEIYSGCGNDQWSATVNYTGANGTEYTLTVLEDDTLLLQYYWEVDGAPMVSYGWYRRIGK